MDLKHGECRSYESRQEYLSFIQEYVEEEVLSSRVAGMLTWQDQRLRAAGVFCPRNSYLIKRDSAFVFPGSCNMRDLVYTTMQTTDGGDPHQQQPHECLLLLLLSMGKTDKKIMDVINWTVIETYGVEEISRLLRARAKGDETPRLRYATLQGV